MVVIYQSKDNGKKNSSENELRSTHIEVHVHRDPVYQPAQQVHKPTPKIDNKFTTDIVATEEVLDDKIDDPQLNSFIVSFLNQFEEANKKKGTEFSANMAVSDVLGGLARFYERIRTTVEYKGEHLLRRNAIERILKRLIWEKGTLGNFKAAKMSASLIKELIWAKYIPNNEISTEKVEFIQKVIEKYEKILEGLDSYPEKVSPAKAKLWILGVASSEIEDILDPSQRDLFVNLMYNWLKQHSSWSESGLNENDKKIQMNLAIHRAFTKSDDPAMRYYLLLQEFRDWNQSKEEDIRKFTLEFPKYYEDIEANLGYKSRLSLYRKVIKFCAPFEILRQVIVTDKENAAEILRDQIRLETKVRETCELNYKKISSRVNTGVIRSIIYIFITKVFLALLMEVPYEIYRYGDIKYIPLSINIIFPPIMMFLIGLSIKIPGVKNTEIIVDRIKSIVYKNKNTKTVINLNTGPSRAFVGAFGIIYFLLFLGVFGGFSTLLLKIGFSSIGLIVFFFFLSLVLLFAYRVRYHAQSLRVEPEKEGILSHLFSYLMLPFLNLGFFLSRGIAQINFFTVLLDLLIEAPLKSMIEVFEEWIGFIKEKRQEVVEVPE